MISLTTRVILTHSFQHLCQRLHMVRNPKNILTFIFIKCPQWRRKKWNIPIFDFAHCVLNDGFYKSFIFKHQNVLRNYWRYNRLSTIENLCRIDADIFISSILNGRDCIFRYEFCHKLKKINLYFSKTGIHVRETSICVYCSYL